MKAAIIRSTVAAFVLCLAGTALAQEGFPLKGSWIGTWGPSKSHDNDMLMVLNWDGKAISGTINPGTDNMRAEERDAEPRGLGGALRGRRQGQDRQGRALRSTARSTTSPSATARSPAPGRAAARAARSRSASVGEPDDDHRTGAIAAPPSLLAALRRARRRCWRTTRFSRSSTTRSRSRSPGSSPLVDWKNPHVARLHQRQERGAEAVQLGGRARKPARFRAERLDRGDRAARATA